MEQITKVIFNDPATIVFWSDGTKTVVKCSEDDEYNMETGLAMAVCKKLCGHEYHRIFRKWIPDEEPESDEMNAMHLKLASDVGLRCKNPIEVDLLSLFSFSGAKFTPPLMKEGGLYVYYH